MADALKSGLDVKDITYIDGTVFKTKEPDDSLPTITLPSFAENKADRRRYAESFKIQYANCDPFTAKRLAEPYDNFFVVQNPPQKPLTTAEMDAVYDLPYMRAYHPSHEKAGGVPAISAVKFSLISNRGCFGACPLRALPLHHSQQEQIHDLYSIFDYRLKLNYELAHEILSMGSGVKVLNPPEPRAMVLHELAELNKPYKTRCPRCEKPRAKKTPNGHCASSTAPHTPPLA